MGGSEYPSTGVTLPKDDLRKEGAIDESGELNGKKHAKIEQTGDGVPRDAGRHLNPFY